jgi:hypothetical protein
VSLLYRCHHKSTALIGVIINHVETLKALGQTCGDENEEADETTPVSFAMMRGLFWIYIAFASVALVLALLHTRLEATFGKLGGEDAEACAQLLQTSAHCFEQLSDVVGVVHTCCCPMKRAPASTHSLVVTSPFSYEP